MASRKKPAGSTRSRARLTERVKAGGGAVVVVDASAEAPRDIFSLSRGQREARCEELRTLIGDRQSRARDGKTPDKITRLREIVQLRSFTYDAEFHALLADLEQEHGCSCSAEDVATAIAPEIELQRLEGIPADHQPPAASRAKK